MLTNITNSEQTTEPHLNVLLKNWCILHVYSFKSGILQRNIQFKNKVIYKIIQNFQQKDFKTMLDYCNVWPCKKLYSVFRFLFCWTIEKENKNCKYICHISLQAEMSTL